MTGQGENTSTEVPSNETDVFAFNEVKCHTLDECMDHGHETECHFMHSLLTQGQRRIKEAKTGHLEPIAFTQFVGATDGSWHVED